MTILITGVAGFIGSHLASKMLSQNFNVLGIDNLTGSLEVGKDANINVTKFLNTLQNFKIPKK